MFKELNNNISKEIMEALEFDLDEIKLEEYEEIHYNPNVKVSNKLVVKKATREELDRIDKLLKKKNSKKYLDEYFETKEAIQEEYEKRYKGTKSKVCNELQVEDFENKMIYTLAYVINYNDNSKYIDTVNFLKNNYKPYEFILQDDKQKGIRKIYLLEENTYEKNLNSYSSRQLKDYQDNIEILLNSDVDKIVLTDRVLRNTFITKDAFETMLTDKCPILNTLKSYYLAIA